MACQSDTVSIQPVLESAAINHRIPSAVLPEELINEILLRLPVKSLLQFKCVCKSWKTLISDPQFAKNHVRIPGLTNQQLFSVLEEPYRVVSYPLKPFFENPSTPVEPVTFTYIKNRDSRIIGSCNGLLCLYYRNQRCFRLCNPSIKFKSRKSPEAVSPSWIILQYGFGYDQVNDKYKVLVIALHIDASQSLTKIYTFGENHWKTIHNFSLTPITSVLTIGKFVSGTLNWLIHNFGSKQRPKQRTILSFDLEKETYREILLPQSDDVNVYIRRMLYVLSNCLCVCDISFTKKHQWDVWLMKDHGVVGSWTKRMFITSENQPCVAQVEPLFILDNGGALLLANKPDSKLVLYNLNNNGGLDYPLISTSRIGLSSHTHHLHHLHIHRESLVSPQL